MGASESYKVWRTIRVEHEYYGSAHVPVVLEPSADTLLLLRKYGVLFRQTAWGRWVLLRPAHLSIADEGIIYKFVLRPTDAEWWYATPDDDVDEQPNHFMIKKSDTLGVWRELLLLQKAQGEEENAEVTISLSSKKKLWEFILIPKFTPEATRLMLTERTGGLTFSAVERVKLFKDFEAYRATSTQPITLLKNAPYRIQLWEVRDSGDRLLSNAVPIPQCTEASILDAKNAITTYFYY